MPSKISDFTKLFKSYKFLTVLLALYSGFIFFYNLGGDGLHSAQEGRAAIIARNMINSGEWFHIIFPGALVSEKPIMSYWFCSLSGLVFGVNEFSMRFPSALAAFITVFLVYWFASKLYGKHVGLLSGFILSSTLFFIDQSHTARIDIVLCAFYTASIMLLYVGYFENMKCNKKIYLFYVVVALSILVKGPVSVGLVGLTILILVIRYRKIKIILDLKPFIGILIVLCIALPWFVYISYHSHGSFAMDFFINQNLSRFTGINMVYRGGRRMSLFYYFPNMMSYVLPWSIFFPFIIIFKCKKIFKISDRTKFLLIWFLVVFIFFSLAAIKRPDYLLPLYAPMAIMIALFLKGLLNSNFAFSRKIRFMYYVVAVLSIIALILTRMGVLGKIGEMILNDQIEWISENDGSNMIRITESVNSHFIMFSVALVVILLLLFYLWRKLEDGKFQYFINAVLAIAFLLTIFNYGYLVPIMNKYESTKEFSFAAQKYIPPEDVICYYDNFNITEAIFYIDRKYKKETGFDNIYNSKTGKFKFDYIVMESDTYSNMPDYIKEKVKVLEKIPIEYHYPLVLIYTKKYKS
ncbi:MAG: glycosyltransferase family 39 protein [bacterium]|nr:glycosyltransferase family 39 protein [bacterium]